MERTKPNSSGIYQEIDFENNKVTFRATKQARKSNPTIASFMDGLTLDLDQINKLDI